MECTYDSSEDKTICDDNQCDTGFAKNDDSGECDGKILNILLQA